MHQIFISTYLAESRKRCHNPDDFGPFLDWQNSTSKYPKMTSKVFIFFRAVAVWISVRAPRRQKGLHFPRPVRVLKVEFRKSENSARILGISGFWNFFWICKIPLVSTLTGCVKCRSFFLLKLFGAVWAPRRQKWQPFSMTLEVLTNGIFKSEKISESWRSQDSGTFFRLEKFLF
jgi:hypothetical protein